MAHWWPAPEGVRIHADGGWSVGEFAIAHLPSLRFLKSHLVFEEDGAFLVQGDRRLPVAVEGPAFEVEDLRLDAALGEACAVLDDGSEESLTEVGMDPASGRFYCAVRGGRARAGSGPSRLGSAAGSASFGIRSGARAETGPRSVGRQRGTRAGGSAGAAEAHVSRRDGGVGHADSARAADVDQLRNGRSGNRSARPHEAGNYGRR